MTLSIALAAWRGTAWLPEQLDSIARQTRLPDELVAVDDASGDGTADWLERYAETAPFPMRVLRNPTNIGYCRTFERALRETSGDLVFPCDQDDFWFPEKLAKMETWASDEPSSQIFACDAELTDGALVPSGRTKRGQLEAAGFPETAFVMGCCLAVRRSYLDLMLPFPDGARGHDNWLVELADGLGLVRRRTEVLQHYRRHGNNASDVFVNSPRKLGPAARFANSLANLFRRLGNEGGLAVEHSTLTARLGRLEERLPGFAALAGPGQVEQLMAMLMERLAMLDARSAARARHLGARSTTVLKLWRSGVYKKTGGLAGAVRDLASWHGA